MGYSQANSSTAASSTAEAQRLLRILEPPLAAFRQTAEPRPQINYMTCAF
jgi:hypothetical protein